MACQECGLVLDFLSSSRWLFSRKAVLYDIALYITTSPPPVRVFLVTCHLAHQLLVLSPIHENCGVSFGANPPTAVVLYYATGDTRFCSYAFMCVAGVLEVYAVHFCVWVEHVLLGRGTLYGCFEVCQGRSQFFVHCDVGRTETRIIVMLLEIHLQD